MRWEPTRDPNTGENGRQRQRYEALHTLVVRGVKETGQCTIPSFLRIRKKTVKAKPERTLKVFGKSTLVTAQPEKGVIRITACKKFADRALEAQ